MVVRPSNVDEDFDLQDKKGSIYTNSNRDSIVDPMRSTGSKIGAIVGNSILNSEGFNPNKTQYIPLNGQVTDELESNDSPAPV